MRNKEKECTIGINFSIGDPNGLKLNIPHNYLNCDEGISAVDTNP